MKTQATVRSAISHSARLFAGVGFCVTLALGAGCLQETAEMPDMGDPGGLDTHGGKLAGGNTSEGVLCDLCAIQGCGCEDGQCVDCDANAYTSAGEDAEGLFCDICVGQGCDCAGDQCVNCEAGGFVAPSRGEMEGLFCDLCTAQGCDCEGGQCVDCGNNLTSKTTEESDGRRSSTLKSN